MSIEEVVPDESNAGWERVLCNLTNSFLDPSGVPKLEIIKAYKIFNASLEDSFRNKVNEFIARGCKESELETRIGFIVENDCKEISELVENGVSVRDSDNNTIGYNCMGVYLCKHLDVCLKHALAKMASVDHYKIIVCQYVSGKTTTAIPRAAVMGDFIEPTPNFTSHVSTILPSARDSIQTQFDRSQVYLYELDDEACPVVTPSHILPLWVVVYGGMGANGRVGRGEEVMGSVMEGNATRDAGILGRPTGNMDKSMGLVGSNIARSEGVVARIEAQMAQILPPSRLDVCSNPRLQRVIEQINSRGMPQQPSKLQQAIDNINNKGQVMNDAYYDNMIDDVTNNYDAKINFLQGARLANHHFANNNNNPQLPSQHMTSTQLANLSNHLTNPQLSSHLMNHHLSNPHLTSEGLLPSLNLISNLTEPLYYCSDTNNLLDVNSLIALATANQNLATILPINSTQHTDLATSSQQQHDYYPLNYLAHSAKSFQQQQQQELMFAASSSSPAAAAFSSSSSASSSSLQKKRGYNDGAYHHLYDKKVRIM